MESRPTLRSTVGGIKITKRSVDANPSGLQLLLDGTARTHPGHVLIPEQTVVRVTFVNSLQEVKTRFALYVGYEKRDGKTVILLNTGDAHGMRCLQILTLSELKDIQALNPQRLVSTLNLLLRD